MQGPDLATPASPVPAIILPVVPKYLPGELEPLLKESHIQADRGVSSAGSRDGLPWVLTTSETCYTSKPLSEASTKYWGSRGPPFANQWPHAFFVQMGKCLPEIISQTGQSWDQRSRPLTGAQTPSQHSIMGTC